MIFHENRLSAGDSHEISCLICKSSKFLMCHILQIIGGALRVNWHYLSLSVEACRNNVLALVVFCITGRRRPMALCNLSMARWARFC